MELELVCKGTLEEIAAIIEAVQAAKSRADDSSANRPTGNAWRTG